MPVVCRFAGSRLAAQRSVAGWVGEAMGGLSYLEYIRGLAKRVEEDWQGVQVSGMHGLAGLLVSLPPVSSYHLGRTSKGCSGPCKLMHSSISPGM